jgi:DNA-binding response OmpR family regulator
VAKILLVDDDKDLAGLILDALTAEQHTVDWRSDGKSGLHYMRYYPFDAVILDWGLPEMPGIDVLRAFREAGGTTPVLMLTGQDQVCEKVQGFEAGADDYLTKPFHMRELSARLKALLRRPGTLVNDVLKVKDLELDSTARNVSRKGKPIQLVPKEYALLEFFMRNPNRVFSVEALMEHVWISDTDITADAVRIAVMRLRKKLESDSGDAIIRTIHKVGYKLESD